MTTFLTFSIYSLNTSSSIPQQSEYLPAITLYFMLCTLFTLTTFTWYIIENFFRNRKMLPKPIKMYVNGLRASEAFLKTIYKAIKCKRKKKNVEMTDVEDMLESSPTEKTKQANQVC
jgi:hypothetical protein